MKKVYVCWKFPDFQSIGIVILSIFSCERDAKLFCEKHNKKQLKYGDLYDYEEYEVK